MNHATPARFLAAHEATAPTPLLPLLPPLPADRDARRLWRQLPPPQAALRSIVIIPAKDEAANLPITLAALAAQVDAQGQPLPAGSFEVIVLANNCQDATASIVRQQAQRWPHLTLHVAELRLLGAKAHVGRARRLLMDAACARLEAVDQPIGIIASTDADTRVAPNWLAMTQAEIAAGADAVGGRILTDADTCAQPVFQALYRIQSHDTAYHLLCARLEDCIDPLLTDRWPRHHQHFGASLALTARAYRQVGGLPEVRFLEDEALCQQLRRHDLALRHSPQVQVLTSARRDGRVEVGLSWQLREWLRMARQQREPHVENPAQLALRWQLRRQLRAFWASGALRWQQTLAASLGVPATVLLVQTWQAATFGALWEWALANAPGLRVDLMPLARALQALPLLIQSSSTRATELVAAATASPAGRADRLSAAAH